MNIRIEWPDGSWGTLHIPDTDHGMPTWPAQAEQIAVATTRSIYPIATTLRVTA
jgi:hypothetical protein